MTNVPGVGDVIIKNMFCRLIAKKQDRGSVAVSEEGNGQRAKAGALTGCREHYSLL